MAEWLVRQEGSPTVHTVPSATDVLNGLRDGNWLPTDEVKGPADTQWRAIELHPSFEEAAAELEPPPPPAEEETNLDMNPLIDVCLVLLIFFILTITYASLERALEIPEDNPDEKGPAEKTDLKVIRDQLFVVSAHMDGNKPVVRLEKTEVPIEQLAEKMKALMESTGRKIMVVDLDKAIPWGIETAILDAAKGNGVRPPIMRVNRPK